MAHKQNRPAVVLLSGGQDSVTSLYWAIDQGFNPIYALTINYGQRHEIEVDAARLIAEMAEVVEHRIIDVPDILLGSSPLVNKDNPVGHYASVKDLPGGVEPTFVPYRNPFFMIIAANYGESVGARDIVTGICQADSGGYPDCRESFRESMQSTLNFALLGSNAGVIIHAPLMNLSKTDSVHLAARLPGAMEALAYSHTCYDGEYPPNPNNHASLLRARGFAEAKIPDPLIVRAKAEGKLPEDYPDSGLVEGTKYAPAKEEPEGEKTTPETDNPAEEGEGTQEGGEPEIAPRKGKKKKG